MSDHTCNNTCLIVNRDGTIVCTITGRCQSQFISANEYRVDIQEIYTSKTHAREHRTKKRDSVAISHDVVRTEVEKYTNLLLFSKKRSDMCDRVRDRNAYDHNHKRHYKKRRRVEILEFDPEQFAKISTDVSQIIIRLLKHRSSSKLKSLIVALLFLKQHGKEYVTKSTKPFVITRSEYLYVHLPSISDLHLFGIQKNMIRIGSNIIQKIVRNISE